MLFKINDFPFRINENKNREYPIQIRTILNDIWMLWGIYSKDHLFQYRKLHTKANLTKHYSGVFRI